MEISTVPKCAKTFGECLYLRLLTHVGFFSKTWSDTFRSVLMYEKEQESRRKIFHNRAKIIHLPEKV